MRCKLRCTVLALEVVANWSRVALAIDAREAASTLANEAKQDFDEGRFEEAGRKFQQAYEVAKVPMFALWAARALARRGQPVAALCDQENIGHF